MNGTGTTAAATSINVAPAAAPTGGGLHVLDEDELDSVWIAVRRQARNDAVFYDELARKRSLNDLADAAIDAATARELGAPAELPRSQRRRLFFDYLETLLACVPR